MHRRTRPLAAFAAALCALYPMAGAAQAVILKPAPAVQPAIQAMLDAAMKANNEADVKTIAKYARKVDPDSVATVEQEISDWKSGVAKANRKHLQEAAFFELLKGKVELGGFLTTGNTRNVGASARVNLTREGLRWRHKLNLAADYQRSAGVTTRRHFLAAYEPNYKIDDDLYIYGAFQYESDHFLGYDNRYSASSGVGYSVIKRPHMTLDLEVGPAFRRTDFTGGTTDSSPALRGSSDFEWHVTPAISVSQKSAGYLQEGNSTLTATTGVNAKLFGPVSGQLSYEIQYESQPRDKVKTTDTISRVSLVYDF